MYELLLVSESPRRRQILKDAGFKFRTDTVKISEIIEENVNLGRAILQIAMKKAQAYLDQYNSLKTQRILLLTADTMVVLGGRALGKPKNSTEAQHFLCQLSGQLHEVVTGICVFNLLNGEKCCDAVTTKVQFREITLHEISEYIASGEPMDKAGAYAIQGEGKKFVQNISGSYTNVVGLPIEWLNENLERLGWHVSRE